MDSIEQFQIGEAVMYEAEGVLTTIRGYLWNEAVGMLPQVQAYELACGPIVPYRALRRLNDQELSRAKNFGIV